MSASAMVLIFTGAAAFLPGATWEAYVVNAPGHVRMLRIPSDIVTGCTSPCKLRSSFCECELASGRLDLPTSGSPATVGKKTGLPNGADAKNIDWLVPMKDLDPGFTVTPNGIKDTVQVRFKWKSAETCSFDEIECDFFWEKKRRIYEIEVEVNGVRKVRQAVPELVAFHGDLGSNMVTIAVPVKSGSVNLAVDCTNGCPVWISNMPTQSSGGGAGGYLCPLDPIFFCDPQASSHIDGYWKLAEKSSPKVRVARDCIGAVHLSSTHACADLMSMRPPLMKSLFSLWFEYDWFTVGDRIICPPVLIQ